MKKLPPFLSGMLTMALIVGLGVSALAATGQLTLTVDPVNIQVNGSTFAPKDAKGNDVPVFAYNGTTYAPLRALAEAYGLTVGYDGAARMATVSSTPAAPDTPPADYSDWSAEDEAAYQEFKGLWAISLRDSGTEIHAGGGVTLDKPWQSYILLYNGLAPKSEVSKAVADATSLGYTRRLAFECRTESVQVSLWYCTDSNATSMNTGLVFIGAYE